MKKIYIDTSDVLVVGGGMAGLYAANSAAMHNPNLKITMLTADEVGSGGCSKRTHGINASINKSDSCDLHYSDTINGGGGINKFSLANILCTNINDRIKELESWGIRFHKSGADYTVGTYGGNTNSRSIHWYDITGLEIVHELVQRSILHNIFIKEYRWGAELITKDSQCYGVIAINKQTDDFEVYYSKAIILATGGGACVYPISSISSDKLACGILMGFNAGAPVVDMEMVQFHPTGIIVKNSIYNGSLLEEELRAQGGTLLNRHGKRYMFDYDERGELATRDIVARSTYIEIANGRGTDNNGVIFDISNLDKNILKKRFPKTVQRLRGCNIDIVTQNKIEISPTAHFLMGGLVINDNCETIIKGLYACGEDAGGIHGGNRLGGNGVADALVFGHIAGIAASNFVSKCNIITQANISYKIDLYDLKPYEIDKLDILLKQIMWMNVGLVREESSLKLARKELNDLANVLKPRKDKVDINKMKSASSIIPQKVIQNKLKLSLLISGSALSRKNSIGAHFRSDSNNDRTKYNVFTKKNEFNDTDIYGSVRVSQT